MARRRKEKSLAEATFGFVMLIVAMVTLNPTFRGQIFSALTTFVAIVFLLGVVGFAVYLIIQLKRNADVPLKAASRKLDSPKMPIQPDKAHTHQYRPENKAKINEIIQSMRPSIHTQNNPPQYEEWNESVLSSIEWKRFEIVTKEFLKMAGYEARETKVGADGGIDIRVCKPGTGEHDGIVQCKAWNTYKVGVKPVRELFGIMAAEKISRGMLITSGEFTAEAEDFAKGKMTLVSGEQFLGLIKKHSLENQKKLLEIALEGDYRTPTCPQCDVKMTLREVKKGRNVGGQFWGCANYPRCKQTLVYKQNNA